MVSIQSFSWISRGRRVCRSIELPSQEVASNNLTCRKLTILIRAWDCQVKHCPLRAIASNFWNCSTSCVITSKLSRLCCISAYDKPPENLDAIALAINCDIALRCLIVNLCKSLSQKKCVPDNRFIGIRMTEFW